jgi:hypothetical protein
MTDKILTNAALSALQARQDSLLLEWWAGLKDAETTPMPPPDPKPTGRGWLSGVADGVDIITGWPAFRGSPTTYARVWADSDRSNMDNLWALQDLSKTGYSGVLDLAVGGPTDWASAATGGYDSVWAGQCRKAFQFYGNLKQLHLSMAHEFNGNWYPWSVSPGQQANFRTAYARWYRIVQAELVAKGKNVKVVLPCNSDTTQGWTLADGLPAPTSFDILGCDFYSMWPPLANQKDWDANYYSMKGDVPRGIGSWMWLAKDLKKPLQFGEWGLNPNQPNNTVDNPYFIQKMRALFASIAPTDPYNPGPGELAGEAYFNNYPTNGRLFPTTTAPQSRTAYLGLKWGTV